jgi:uncharacterized protein YdeI (YjbR/CyaY-like superfamily)
MPTDPRVDAYIARQADFARPILEWLRARVHAACPEVEEGIKWSRPFFGYKGRPIAQMSGFKAHAAFGFWQGMDDPTGKENEASGHYGRLTAIADLPPADDLEARVREAMARVDGGTKRPRAPAAPKGEADVPAALAEALARDDLAAKTFNAFPPSARRDYCEWIAEAKRDETRDKRLADAIQWLREGKKRNWKYEV